MSWILAWYQPDGNMPTRQPDVVHRVLAEDNDLPAKLASMYLPITPLDQCWIFRVNQDGTCAGWNLPLAERP
jgi:hypothetical protein